VTQFFRFTYSLIDKGDEIAGWDDNMGLEQILCEEYDEHKRSGKRFDPLYMVLYEEQLEDIIWLPWTKECIIQDHVLDIFKKEGLTGFEVKPVQVRYKNSNKPAPKLWELVVTGWAGMASSITGIKYIPEKSCLICGLLRYVKPKNLDFTKIIDEKCWDGSDFFIVWPLPKFYFITQKVVDVIMKYNLKGLKLDNLSEIKTSKYTKEFGPSRLRNFMPDKRAHELGDSLGIY